MKRPMRSEQPLPQKALSYSKSLLTVLETVGLWVIALATLIAAGQEVAIMVAAGRVTLADLLLLFIYLEILTMVGVYLESGELPVRLPLYIGIVALARYLILDMKNMDAWRMLAVATAVLLLALAVLVAGRDSLAVLLSSGT
jgi:protein PsiE